MSNLTPLEALRLNMKQNGVDAVVIPQTDPHHGEYIADHWQLRRHISGFTGSAGTLVVTAGDARLWTDSRYFLHRKSDAVWRRGYLADSIDNAAIVKSIFRGGENVKSISDFKHCF